MLRQCALHSLTPKHKRRWFPCQTSELRRRRRRRRLLQLAFVPIPVIICCFRCLYSGVVFNFRSALTVSYYTCTRRNLFVYLILDLAPSKYSIHVGCFNDFHSTIYAGFVIYGRAYPCFLSWLVICDRAYAHAAWACLSFIIFLTQYP